MRELLIAGGILVGLWLLAAVVLLAIGRKTTSRELVTFLPNLIRLFRGLLRDERVPRSSKVLLLLGGFWLASPIDLIPEFLPGVGTRREDGQPGHRGRRRGRARGRRGPR